MRGVVSFLIVTILSIVSLGAAAPATATKPAYRAAPPGVTIERDVTFLAPGRAEKLDVYLPADRDNGAKSPAVVMIHGGGWVGGDKAAGREFNTGTLFAKSGYVCVSVNYKLDGDDRWPTNLYDCKNAVRFLRANADKYGVDVEHIGVIGGSAGGHLALMVGYTSDVKELTPTDSPYPGVSDRVNCVVNLYGITDPRTRRKTDEQGTPAEAVKSCALFPGKKESDDPEAWRLSAPVSHVSSRTVPTLTLHGTADTTVDRDQAKRLDDALAKAGVEHETIMIAGVGHSFDLETWKRKPLPRDIRPVVLGFFDKHLKAK